MIRFVILLTVLTIPAFAQQPLSTATLAGLQGTLPTGFANAKQNIQAGVSINGQLSGGGTVTISNGIGPFTCTVPNNAQHPGTLPTGMTISATTSGCVVGGTPTGSGQSSFTIQVADSSVPAKGLFIPTSINVATITSMAVTGTQNIAPSATSQLVATGTFSDTTTFILTRVTGISWTSSVTACATVNTSGLVTATAMGSCTSNITATFNSVSNPTFTITVSSGTPAVTISSTSPLPDCLINIACATFTFTGSGGTPPYTWTVSSGNILSGLTLASNGNLTGTCNAAVNNQSVTIQIKDSAGTPNIATKAFTETCAGVQSEAVTVASTSIAQGATTQATSTTTYTDGKTANTTVGSSGLGTPTMVAATPTVGTSLTTTINSPANVSICLDPREAIDSTSTWTVTDSSSNTYTLVKTNNSYGTHVMTLWCTYSTTAVTSVTASYSPGTQSTVSYIVVMESGTLTSGIVDSSQIEFLVQSNISALPTNNALTTTNPIDVLFYCVDAGTSATSFTAAANWTIPSGGSNARQGCAYQIVSATQSGLNTTMSWGGTSAAAGGFLFALKGSATATGASWVPNNPTICTVNSSGLITGVAAGTCTVSATVGGQTGTSPTITVTSGVTDTALNITPNPGSCSPGGTVSFTAKGNNTGQDYTTQARWSSNNTTVATMTNNIATCVAVGSATITAQFP